MAIDRFEDWAVRLDQYFLDQKDRAFEWGTFDCVLFSTGAVEAMTGVQPAAAFIGRYKTKRGAAAVIRNDGFGSLSDACDHVFGERKANINRAKRGDVVAFQTDIGIALGVVDLSGTHFRILSEHEGVLIIPIHQALYYWSI